MRLIDADSYAAELWEMRQNYQMLDDTQTADKIMHGLYRAEQALKDAPTIDAVPVEWIKEQIERLKSQDNVFASLTAGMIDAMLTDYCADGKRNENRN